MGILDWWIVAGYLIVTVFIGWWSGRRSSNTGSEDFFLSGRNIPWWMLGISMVATTFSADTPNLVTDLVRQYGVAGNWAWWAFLITGMITVFVYSKLWRRSGMSTDLEFYEIRYSGKVAAWLRGFRSIYLGLVFNVLIMASVSLAAIKMGSILLGLAPWQTLLLAGSITLFYSLWGGLRSVVYTDILQFLLAMAGSIAAALYLVDYTSKGNWATLWDYPEVQEKMSFLPSLDRTDLWVTLIFVPLCVQWWSAWYPGAEPGGGGYIAQRMLAAKNEKDAMKATMLFTLFHYAIRPWPWILVAFCSLVVYPDLESLKVAFPELPAHQIANDMAYPAMIRMLPTGLMGVMAAALMAAFMSTLSTHLNWGSSYLVLDFYARFIKPEATEKEKVYVGRITTVLLLLLAVVLSLFLSNALQAFGLLLQIGAGTGLIYFLRWYWDRINAYTEISGMLISFLTAIFLELIFPVISGYELSFSTKMLIGVGITTIGWVTVSLLTPPESKEVLKNFKESVFAEGDQHKTTLKKSLIKALASTAMVYCILFGSGFIFYGQYVWAGFLLVPGILIAFFIFRKL